MSVFTTVLGSLQTMSLLQLLLAFMACGSYALAQGALLHRRGQRVAWVAAGAAATGFAVENTQWVHAVVLVAIAVAGVGAFVGAVWLMSRSLGLVPRQVTGWRWDDGAPEASSGGSAALPFGSGAVHGATPGMATTHR